MFTIFFSGEKLASLDSLSKGKNMDYSYLCNTFLEGVKASALTGTRKATLRDFQIHMDNCKLRKFEINKRKIGRDPAHSMGLSPILTRYCTVGLLVLRVEKKRDEGTGLLEYKRDQNILTQNVDKNGFRSIFQHI
jgi:hypothetical protein